jgi:hypothetical protein
MLLRPFLSAPDMSAARTEMETNYFGTLAMAGSGGRWRRRPCQRAVRGELARVTVQRLLLRI